MGCEGCTKKQGLIEDRHSVIQQLRKIVEELEAKIGGLQSTVFLSIDAELHWRSAVEFLEEQLEKAGAELAEAYNMAYDFMTQAAELQVLSKEQVQQKERLYQKAFSHPLTGLRNIHYLRQDPDGALRREACTQKSWGVVFLDLDGFKEVNDTLGHDIGDGLLQDVGEVLNTTFRSRETLVVHPYGDEFCVFLFNLKNIDQMQELVNRLRTRVCSVPLPAEKEEKFVSASFGAYYVPSGFDKTPEEAIKKADKAMYAAKQDGRGNVVTWTAGVEE